MDGIDTMSGRFNPTIAVHWHRESVRTKPRRIASPLPGTRDEGPTNTNLSITAFAEADQLDTF